MGIVIENPGILTTVQDEGRFGYQQFGVSPAGPMGARSFRIANILAGNLLRAQPFVDESRVGVTGISWGGVSASILIGFEQRFAFAVPVYGSACGRGM